MKSVCLLIGMFFWGTFSGFAQLKSVMLVPFDSKLFNNQESEVMLEDSDMTYEQSIQFFTTSLDEYLTRAVKDTMRIHSLLRTYTTDAYSDIDIVHQQSDYVLTERPQSISEKKDLSAFQNAKSRFKKRKKLSPHIAPPDGEIVSDKEDNNNKFLSVKFVDSQVFIDLIQNYNVDYVVFITQFEILGDYSDPYAVAQQSYFRTIRVHYAIFDKSGKFVYGDYETNLFSASHNNISEVCSQNFPEIARKIMRRVP
ncbi:MAG: hypothetical protein ACOCWB_09005 [Bacteroidota bacterium]